MKKLINLRNLSATLAQRLRRPCAATESCYRLVSVPLSSRIRFMVILCLLLTVGVGNAWGANWNKVADLSDISNGDSVLVVIQDGKTLTSGKAFKVGGTTSANHVDITITSNSYISDPANNTKWAMSKSNGVYTFTNGNTNKIATGSTSNGNVGGNGGTYYTWYISKLSDGYFKVQYNSNSGMYISWKGSAFGKYANSNFVNQMTLSPTVALAAYHGAISFYKKGSSTYTVSSSVSPTGKGTVTLGASSLAQGATTTATYSNIATGYSFNSWSISGTGSTLSSTSTNPTTITMGSANTTVTLNLQAISRTISYSGDSHISSYTTKPTSATIEDEDITVEYTVESGYQITGVSATIGGVAVDASDMEWDQSSLYILPPSGITGNVNITFTIAELGGYCISVWNSSNNGIQSGFSNGGSGNEYTMSFTVPGKDGSSNWPMYWIGENNASQSYSANAYLADMKVTTCNATIGLAQGATGTLHIWDDNKAAGSNLHVKFEPSGYGFRWGGAGEWNQAANTKAFTVDPGDANVYWTEIVTLDGTNNTTWNYYVGLQTASGYVYSGVDNEASDSRGISRTRSVTAMKVSNGTAGSWKGTYLSSEPTGSRGKFRIWNNNITDYNFVCHWVPFYRVTYNGSGASGSTSPSADVCCEGNAAARTVKAAANGFTVPTGKSFGGWADSPEHAAAKTVAYAVNADVTLTGSITLYAIWNDVDYTVTVNQSPSVGATTTGQTSTAHYNTTINLTTTVPSGYRFVNWTTSDGFAITNNTSATTASFTMPNKNVTVTANFQQTHTIDWYVGGSAPGNKLPSSGQTVVVDHGGSITTLPSEPSGSACDKEFMGWTNTSSYTHGTSPLYPHNTASFPAINADASFYAVFATENVATGYTYIGDDGLLEEGETYIFVSSKSTGSAYALKSSDLPNNNTSGVKGTAVSVTVATGIKVATENSDLEFTCTTHTADEIDVLQIGEGSNTLRINGNGIGYGTARAYYDNTGLYGWNNSGNTYYDVYYNSTSEKFEASSSASGRVYAYKKGGTTYTDHTITCASCSNEVTVSFSAPGSGNTMTVAKGVTSLSSGDAVKTCSAVALTVTLTPADHYTVTNFAATGVTGVTTSNVGNVYTVNIPADKTGTLTLTPTFTAETPLTITLNTNSKGTFTPIGTIYSGDSFTFPEVTPNDAECADFVGWVEGTSIAEEGTSTEPTTIAAGSSSGTLTTNKTYTAVYAEKDKTESDAYVKVTSSLSNWSGTYLIVHDGSSRALDGSLTTTLGSTGDYFSVSITDGAIAATSTLATKNWTIAKIGETSTYTIKSASGYYIGRATASNGLDYTTTAGDADANSITYSSGVSIAGSASTAKLQYWVSGTNACFKYYTSSQNAVSLYKLGTAEVVTYTYTVNPACTAKYRVTVNSATGGSPNADPKYLPEGETVTLTANPAAGYTFTSWTITKTTGGDNVTTTLLTGSKPTTANTSFAMPAYDVTVTATYAKIYVTSVVAKEGETTLNTSDHKLNINTGANKTVTVVVTPSDAFDHSWSAEVTSGGTYASISNVADGSFRVNGLSQGDATIVVTAPNDDGTDRTATFTVHVTDVLPEAIILKRDGSSAEIDNITMYYDVANSRGQYVKVNVSYSPTPTNKSFTFGSANTGKVGSHSHAPANLYEVLVANGVTTDPVNCTFTSSADGSVTKVLAVTVVPLLSDQFVDYIHGNATQTVSAALSADRYSLSLDITTPSLTDASDANPTSADCKTAHYHLIGWLPQATAEALWAAGTAITESTEGLVSAGTTVEASGQTWYAIWAKEQ